VLTASSTSWRLRVFRFNGSPRLTSRAGRER
jgi:hypothetical protein